MSAADRIPADRGPEAHRGPDRGPPAPAPLGCCPTCGGILTNVAGTPTCFCCEGPSTSAHAYSDSLAERAEAGRPYS
jgi:hypothetical protein